MMIAKVLRTLTIAQRKLLPSVCIAFFPKRDQHRQLNRKFQVLLSHGFQRKKLKGVPWPREADKHTLPQGRDEHLERCAGKLTSPLVKIHPTNSRTSPFPTPHMNENEQRGLY